VAQGVHWFDFDMFYNEVNRASEKESGIIAVWSYGMHKINPKIDKISERLNIDGDILGNFCSKKIKFIKEDYRTIIPI
jgi:hypothetical protein